MAIVLYCCLGVAVVALDMVYCLCANGVIAMVTVFCSYCCHSCYADGVVWAFVVWLLCKCDCFGGGDVVSMPTGLFWR